MATHMRILQYQDTFTEAKQMAELALESHQMEVEADDTGLPYEQNTPLWEELRVKAFSLKNSLEKLLQELDT